MPKTNDIGICCVKDCGKPERSINLCANHYQLYRKRGSTDKLVRDRTNSPYYHLWLERKVKKIIAAEWSDFDVFLKDIGFKPSGHYFLVRPNQDKPYGPNNFEWREKLKRADGESDKDWYARKWKSRHEKTPGFESKRRPGRRFGFSIGQYDLLLAEQGGVCAICKQSEITIHHQTKSIKRLSIDHCHKTNKIRELLCVRCNLTIGKVNDSIELLEAMKQYLIKHS